MAKKRRRKLKKQTKFGIIGGVLLVVAILGFIWFFFGGGSDIINELRPPQEPEKRLNIVDLDSDSRPFAVVINNLAAARPNHAGLQDAFIVYEFIVESGITRLLALFRDQETERIGSVRSARHYFIDYALENDAIFVYHGQSPQAQADFRNLNVDRINVNTTTTGWRDFSIVGNTEHTLFTSIEYLKRGLGNIRRETNRELLLNYSIELIDLSELEGAVPANNVSIRYSTSLETGYEFDPVNRVYKRSVNGIPHTDAITNKQYTVKNIITYQVANSLIPGGEAGRQQLANVGSGEGWFITNGYAVPITWSKSSRTAQTIYKLKDGTILTVNDGNTFIQIQPVGQPLYKS